jgi:hypothetical protein
VSDSVTEERIAVALTAGSVSVGELAEVKVTLPTTATGLVVPNASVRQERDQRGDGVDGRESGGVGL